MTLESILSKENFQEFFHEIIENAEDKKIILENNVLEHFFNLLQTTNPQEVFFSYIYTYIYLTRFSFNKINPYFIVISKSTSNQIDYANVPSFIY